MQQTLAGVLQDKLPQLKRAGTFYLAYSGGLDSSVLLHLLVREGIPFTAIHVNHQLLDASARWQQHCEEQAAKYGIPILACAVTVEERGKGVEEAARIARYAVFDSVLTKDDILLTAHHADDQAETFLFRLMRGAGATGLSAIRERRALKNSVVYRPLLGVSREAIDRYAREQGLQWVDDDSNLDTRFDRNFLRNTILPPLKQRWPAAVQRIAACIETLSLESALLREYANDDLARCGLKRERAGESVAIDELFRLSIERRQQVIRCWMANKGLPSASKAQLAQLEKMMASKVDAKPELLTASWAFRRFANRLYLLPPKLAPLLGEYEWLGQDALALGDESYLALRKGSPANFTIRFRQGGERCQPADRSHSQSLKKLFQEYRLEPWWRDTIPLVYLDDKIIAAGDLFVCKGYESLSFEWVQKSVL